MPSPLRKSGGGSSSLSAGSSKNSSSSSSDKGSSSYLDSNTNEDMVKKKKKGNAKLNAVKYRAILLKNQGLTGDKKKSKSDKKKIKKSIAVLKVRIDLEEGEITPETTAVPLKSKEDGGKLSGGGGGISEECFYGVQPWGAVLLAETGEIRPEKSVPLEPQEDGGKKINAEICGGGGFSEECCKDVQPESAVLEMAEERSDEDDNVCAICKLGGSGGTLLGCNGRGCKSNYHLKCLGPPLKNAPPSDWYCICCVKKNIESGVLLSPAPVVSNLDAVEVELADSEGVDKTKTILCNNNDCKERPVRVASDSKFVEYWVPVKLSGVQLEQYCHILLSNSTLLRSISKNETVQGLREVLISAKKCCDHPYFVDPSLQKILTNGLSEAEYLNVGIKASGKLQALDKILSETKKQGLRVVIIFQSNVGSSGISLGDVLDDVVHQRCGVDSYERVDRGLIVAEPQSSRNKQAAMNRFNDKGKGRLVFLLDRRACLPSIKLSSVDIVILYDSDLNPCNDLKVLQKITIDSQHEQLKVLRLYSLCTLEEMALIHAKQDVTVDALNLNRSTIHLFLRWGASNLFKELTELHGSSPSSGPVFSSEHLMKELFGPLPHDPGSPRTINSPIVVKVNPTGGTHTRDTSLPGMESVDEDLPHVFWTKLLNGKTPKWSYLRAASLSQRIRKQVQLFDGSPEKTGCNIYDVTKKRRKVLSSISDAGAHKSVDKEGTSRTPAGGCYKFLPCPAVPTDAACLRKANRISSIPADRMGQSEKLFVQQEVEGEIVLPPPSEPLSSEPPVVDKVELVSNSASRSASQPRIQLSNGIQSEPPRPEEHVEIPSNDVVAPLETMLQLSLGRSNTCALDSRSVRGVPGTINHPRQSAPITSSRISQSLLHHDTSSNESSRICNELSIQLGLNTPQQAEFPTQQAATEVHSELPSHNDVLQDTMLQQTMIINRCVGRSGTRVSDFTSLGVVPDRIRDPLPIPAFTSFQFPQTPMRDDPLLHELLRIRREQEQAVKSHEELDKRIRVDYMNEVQEINKKYSKLHQDNEIALAQTKNAMHTIYNTIFMNERLAEVYRSKML